MKLYYIFQSKNTGWDTYSDAVVCAESEEEAKIFHPNGRDITNEYGRFGYECADGSWCQNYSWVSVEDIFVKYLGEADFSVKRGIIYSSYHAG